MNYDLLSFQKILNKPQDFDFASVGIIKTGSIDQTNSTTFEIELACSFHCSSTGVQAVGGWEVRTAGNIYELLRQLTKFWFDLKLESYSRFSASRKTYKTVESYMSLDHVLLAREPTGCISDRNKR
jgi:hypothetical protein